MYYLLQKNIDKGQVVFLCVWIYFLEPLCGFIFLSADIVTLSKMLVNSTIKEIEGLF